jgi:hypothetical protein
MKLKFSYVVIIIPCMVQTGKIYLLKNHYCSPSYHPNCSMYVHLYVPVSFSSNGMPVRAGWRVRSWRQHTRSTGCMFSLSVENNMFVCVWCLFPLCIITQLVHVWS